jgi:mono/diheme cytochrome c family protein
LSPASFPLTSFRPAATDLKDIAIYLKNETNGGSANKTASADPPDQTMMKAGAQIYADECSACYTSNGKGVSGLFPSLNGSPVVQQTDPTSALHVVLRGALSVGTKPAPAMPQFGWMLNDNQVAAVLTYIRNARGNAAPAVSASQVKKTRQMLVERSD